MLKTTVSQKIIPGNDGSGKMVRLARQACCLLLIVSAAVLSAGCASMPAPTVLTQEMSTPPVKMTLMQGDTIEIQFFGAAELNTIQTIRRDGKIALHLVEDVYVEGLTPDQLRQELLQRYASQLQIKSVMVRLLSHPPVFITGAVIRPGKVEVSRPMTVFDAISESGGFNAFEAEVRSVILIRHEAGKRNGFVFDLKDALSGVGADRSFYVRPYDIIYVPRTFITKADQWVEQHINRILPDIGVGYSSEGELTVYR